MITARELVFYIRAEDQASRVVKRVGQSFGSLSNIRALEAKASAQQLTNLANIDKAQQRILKNNIALERAQVTASRLSRVSGKGGAIRGYTAQETAQLAAAATLNVEALSNQERILAENLDEVRRSGDAASASLDRQLSSEHLARIQSFITGFQGVARAARLAGVVVGASLAFAAHQAASFNTQITLAASQARPAGAPASATANIAQQLTPQVLALMQKFPATAKEMADSFYQIFSGTNIQSVKQATQYVKLFNEAAVGGGATLAEMTQAGISIRNVFGIGLQGEFKNMTQALNVFFSAVRYGRMTASQFASALGYISPIAKDVHLSFKNIAEDMAFFTRQTGGNMTRQDAQGLARLIQLFARQDVVAGLAQKGIPVFNKLTGAMRPVVDIIKQIHDQLSLTPQQTVNFFKTISAAGSGKSGTQGTIQAIRVFAQGIQNRKAYGQVVNSVRTDSNEFIRSYEALSKTPGVRWGVVLNQIRAMVIVIGTQAIPAIMQLTAPLLGLVKRFNSLSEGTKHSIAVIGVFASVAAVLGGTLVILVGSLAKFALTIKELRLASLAGEAGFASIRFALMAGVLGALILVLYKYPHAFTDITNAMGGTKNALLAITIFAGAFSLSKIVSSLTLVEGEAGAAANTVDRLRSSLLGIVAIGAIGIPIVLHISHTLANTPDKAGQSLKYSGGISGFFAKLGTSVEYGANRLLGKNPEQARAAVVKDVHDSMFKFGTSIINDPNITPATIAAQVKAQNKLFGMGPLGDAIRRAILHPEAVVHAPLKVADYVSNSVSQADKNAAWTRLFNKAKQLSLIANANPANLKDWNDYYTALDKLQAASVGNQFQAAQQVIGQIDSVQKKSITAGATLASKTTAQARKDLNTMAKDLTTTYNDILSQNQQSFGTIFSGPILQNIASWGGMPSGQQLQADLNNQVGMFSSWSSQLDRLTKRGAPVELVKQIRALGLSPATLMQVKALTDMSPTMWKRYEATWNKGQALIKKDTVKQLQGQLSLYKQHGANIAKAIASGITSQDLAVETAIRNMLVKAFPELAKTGKITKVGSVGAIGKHLAPTTSTRATQSAGGTHYHEHTTIQVKEDDLNATMTALKHSKFYYRNRRQLT